MFRVFFWKKKTTKKNDRACRYAGIAWDFLAKFYSWIIIPDHRSTEVLLCLKLLLLSQVGDFALRKVF